MSSFIFSEKNAKKKEKKKKMKIKKVISTLRAKSQAEL